MTDFLSARTSQAQIKQLDYVAGLDGLRGIAVTAVVLAHCGLADGGSLGVSLFFVLSGFLITRILREEIRCRGGLNLKAFYIRRLLRLTPALWLLIVTYCLYSLIETLLNIGPGAWNVLWSSVFSASYIMNWVWAFELGPKGDLGHTWSLAVEEQFYLLWPILLALLMRVAGSKARVVAIGILGISIAYRYFMLSSSGNIVRIYTGFDTRACELLVGCSLAFFDLRQFPRLLALLWPLPAALLTFWIFNPVPDVQTFERWIVVNDLAAAWIIATLVRFDRTAWNFLRWRALSWTGRISYGIYLWHFPIYLRVAGVIPVYRELLGEHHPAVVFAIVFAMSCVIASLSYVYVERPILAWRSRWPSPQANG